MTSTVNLARVDIADIVGKSVSDSELLSNYYLLVSDAELVPDNHIVKDLAWYCTLVCQGAFIFFCQGYYLAS